MVGNKTKKKKTKPKKKPQSKKKDTNKRMYQRTLYLVVTRSLTQKENVKVLRSSTHTHTHTHRKRAPKRERKSSCKSCAKSLPSTQLLTSAKRYLKKNSKKEKVHSVPDKGKRKTVQLCSMNKKNDYKCN